MDEEKKPFSLLDLDFRDLAFGWTAGAITFPTTLFGYQFLILRPLGIAAHQTVVASVFGAAAVFGAGIISSIVAKHVAYAGVDSVPQFFNNLSVSSISDSISTYANNTWDIMSDWWQDFEFQNVLTNQSWNEVELDLEMVTWGTISMISFMMVGGQFRRLAPSSLIEPGAFAYEYLPAKSENYASQSQRDRILEIGKQRGCHSCGKFPDKFIGDHIPPSGTKQLHRKQRFYPQCRPCSQQQALVVRLQRSWMKCHVSPRLWHFFVPLGLVTTEAVGGYLRYSHSENGSIAESTQMDWKTKVDLEGTATRLAVFFGLRDPESLQPRRSSDFNNIFTNSLSFQQQRNQSSSSDEVIISDHQTLLKTARQVPEDVVQTAIDVRSSTARTSHSAPERVLAQDDANMLQVELDARRDNQSS